MIFNIKRINRTNAVTPIILCTKRDRLGRNTADMSNIVDTCYKKDIAIRFLENGLSTEGTMGKMVFRYWLLWLRRNGSAFWSGLMKVE